MPAADDPHSELVRIDPRGERLWEQVFTVAPLVIVGSQEPDGSHDLAPKHLALPLGWGPWWGFVCTPDHGTYHNVVRTGCFTATYPRPDQVVVTSLSAAPRDAQGVKHALAALPTFPAREVQGVFVAGGHLFLECVLEQVVEDLGPNALMIGRVVAAHADPRAVREAEVDEGEQLRGQPLLAYLHPDRFAVIADTLRFPLHRGFSR